MPELPEVETIRRYLSPVLRNRIIKNVVIRRNDAVGFPSSARFRQEARNARIYQISRKGKYLLFSLTSHKVLVIHLRLSGQLRITQADQVPKYERIRFILDNDSALSFIEPRVLGKVYLLKDSELSKIIPGLAQMGLEPIDHRFNTQYLAEKFIHRQAKVKTLLLDQKICAGVGNIYSDEALFYAGIMPIRPAGSLRRNEVKRLVIALRHIINKALRAMGTTMTDGRYLQPDGARGMFQYQLMVVGRESLPCYKCGKKIIRITISNRSSYYCPVCQH